MYEYFCPPTVYIAVDARVKYFTISVGKDTIRHAQPVGVNDQFMEFIGFMESDLWTIKWTSMDVY